MMLDDSGHHCETGLFMGWSWEVTSLHSYLSSVAFTAAFLEVCDMMDLLCDWFCCVIDLVCVCVVICCFGNYLCNWFADIWCVAFYVIEFNFLFRCYRVDVLLWCAVDLLCKDLFYGWFVAKHWFVVFFDLLCWFFDALLVWCVTQMCHWFAVWRFVVSLIPCVIALLCSWKTVIVVGCLCGWFGDTWCDSLLCP